MFGPTTYTGPHLFRHMLELKIRSLRIWHDITQFQLNSDAGETFVKVAIFMKQKMVLFTKVVPTFELSSVSDRSRRSTAVAVGYLAVAEFAVAEFCKAVGRRKAVGGQNGSK